MQKTLDQSENAANHRCYRNVILTRDYFIGAGISVERRKIITINVLIQLSTLQRADSYVRL